MRYLLQLARILIEVLLLLPLLAPAPHLPSEDAGLSRSSSGCLGGDGEGGDIAVDVDGDADAMLEFRSAPKINHPSRAGLNLPHFNGFN